MDTAKFNEKITLYCKENQIDEHGLIELNLVKFGDFYANVKFNSGNETIKAGVIAYNMASIRIRMTEKTNKITPNFIGEWRNKYFNIKSVQPDLDSRKYIDIVAEFGVINEQNLMG